eukprot:2528055-Amphidinium_carterae.1
MFGKPLRDVTEEDLRNHVASMMAEEPAASEAGSQVATYAEDNQTVHLPSEQEGAAPSAEPQPPLTEEELRRLDMLADMGRSQMPAVHKADGQLEKTIEHYTFADSPEAATLYIFIDRDLYTGASAALADGQVLLQRHNLSRTK